jgi:citrate synthase
MLLIGRGENPEHERLLEVITRCHQSAALRNQNASSSALQLSASMGAEFSHSIASALLTFGDIHGPTSYARRVIFDYPQEKIADIIDDGEQVPGWGNSFFKSSVDPSFAEFAHLIKEDYPDHEDKLQRVSEIIFKMKGKVLYPNAAAYTAVCAEILDLPRGCEIMLPIICRVPAWAAQWTQVQK